MAKRSNTGGAIDPARLAVFESLATSIAEEMGATLRHTALSPNIKERADYSCAVFDAGGRLLAQAAHIPVHLGAMPESVGAVRELAPWSPGDIAILNDPFRGGTHLPDVTMVSPVFRPGHEGRGSLVGYVASRAHQADIGGMAPGSMPMAQELVQEGFIIPPVRLYRAGALVPETLALFLRNVRTPVERQGDVDAQVAAQRVGERRLAALAERFGAAGFRRASAALLDAGERAALAGMAAIPPGAYAFEDALDDDGASDEPVPIRLRLTTSAAGWDLDFTGSAGQRPGSINAVAAVTRSASYYVLRCLLPAGAPTNAGLFRPAALHAAGAVGGERGAAGGGRGGQRRDEPAHRRRGLGGDRAGAARSDAGRVGGDDEQRRGGRHRPAHGAVLGVLRDERRRAGRRPAGARA